MRIFKRKPEHFGYVRIGNECLPEYKCPECGFGVHDDWMWCPHCGQKLGKFKENKNVKYVRVLMAKDCPEWTKEVECGEGRKTADKRRI